LNKKILMSMLTVGVVLAAVGGATVAIFSDTETSSGNTFSAGTIDISVGDEPWTTGYILSDMKPCYTDYIDFTIHNDGTNPANIWKILKSFETGQGVMSEPECEAEGGTWVDYGDHCKEEEPVHNVDDRIYYDLRVELYDKDPDTHAAGPVWWQTIYMDEDAVTVGSLENDKMYLGMVPAGWWLKVYQSYHMPDWVGNKFQGDTLAFEMELYAEQLTNTITLENKDEVDGDLAHLVHDDIYGTLTHNVKGPTFNYEFEATGLAADTGYSLIYYADPWAGNHPGALIDTFTTNSSGDIALTPGSIDLGMDLPDSTDANYPGGAKIWLVLSSDYNSGNASTGPMTGWHPGSYLFETGLIEYDDTDL